MMNANRSVTVGGISKKFCRSLKRSFYYGGLDIVGELTGHQSDQLRHGEFWALKDVSFELKAGEALGLIGANGSGKTTLLKVLSGLIKPTEGSAEINGRLAPLLALGAGFNPILSGRENILVNLSILGLSKKQISQRFDSVIDFAELRDAIDAPLRTYSSGMAARLGFSCAVHTNPDVIFVDEVLAVGDSKFRSKCYQKLSSMREAGTALILVSHSDNAILSACEKALYLKKGRSVFFGDSQDAIQIYQEDLNRTAKEAFSKSPEGSLSLPDNLFSIDSVTLMVQDRLVNSVTSGGQASIKIRFNNAKKLAAVQCTAIIRDLNAGQVSVLNLNSERDGSIFTLQKGNGHFDLHFPYVSLKPGRYSVKVSISSGNQLNILGIDESLHFTCEANNAIANSLFNQERRWSYQHET